MNFIDRVFLVILLAFTLLLLNTGKDILDYIVIDDFLILIMIIIIIWQLTSISYCRIIKFFIDKEEIIVHKKVDLIPIIEEVVENKNLRKFKAEHIEKMIDNNNLGE